MTQAGLKNPATWLSARGTETTTHIGVATGAALVPLILGTITAALAGDIPGAVTSGVPALIGIVGALAAIITPSPQGVTEAQIKAAIAALSREELIGLVHRKPPAMVNNDQ
jgi:hypothetical protein